MTVIEIKLRPWAWKFFNSGRDRFRFFHGVSEPGIRRLTLIVGTVLGTADKGSYPLSRGFARIGWEVVPLVYKNDDSFHKLRSRKLPTDSIVPTTASDSSNTRMIAGCEPEQNFA